MYLELVPDPAGRLATVPRTHGIQGKSTADEQRRNAYDKVFNTLPEVLSKALTSGSKRLLATSLQTLLAYPDSCTWGETVFDPRTEEIIVQVPPLS